MAKKSKKLKELEQAAQSVIDGMEQRALQQAPKELALLEMLSKGTFGAQESGSTKSAPSEKSKRGSLKARKMKYPKKPEMLKIPSEKEMMEGGTYSPPQEYGVKKPAPSQPTPSASSKKPPK